MSRPRPPSSLLTSDPDPTAPNFAPASEVHDWIMSTFIAEGAPLHNPDHEHLQALDLGVLWAATGYEKQQRMVRGTMEQVAFRSSGWQRWRQEDQFNAWFGRVPMFLMTLDATFADHCTDQDWCALVEHELYHIGQGRDEFGAPSFTKEGMPKLVIRGHDVEEFTGVVRRYGPSPDVQAMVDAASKRPALPGFSVAAACGTCLQRAA